MIQLRATLYEDQAPRSVSSVQALIALLEEAAAEAERRGLLTVVFLAAPNDDNLSIALGGTETALTFNYGHLNPPNYASEGAMNTDEPVLTAFTCFEHHTEYLRRWVVPIGAGYVAAEEFLTTGARPTAVGWVEA